MSDKKDELATLLNLKTTGLHREGDGHAQVSSVTSRWTLVTTPGRTEDSKNRQPPKLKREYGLIKCRVPSARQIHGGNMKHHWNREKDVI